MFWNNHIYTVKDWLQLNSIYVSLANLRRHKWLYTIHVHTCVCVHAWVCGCVSVSVWGVYENTGAMQLSNPDKCSPGQLWPQTRPQHERPGGHGLPTNSPLPPSHKDQKIISSLNPLPLCPPSLHLSSSLSYQNLILVLHSTQVQLG